MPTFAGFLAPYIVALAAFPLLAKRASIPWIVPLGVCLLIVAAPWLIPPELRLLRFLVSISAAVLAIKVIDVAVDVHQRRVPTWQQYFDFLVNPFTHVRRCLAQERRPPWRENLFNLVWSSAGCAVGLALLFTLFGVDWSGWSFLIEHVAKTFALMLAIGAGLSAAAATWRLSGGTARDFMDKPYAAKTPAEFWRRYNRNVQQFFWRDIFTSHGGRRAPIQTMLLVFTLSALLHELIFWAAVGRVQGYQTAFFLVQGVAAASTARVKVKGWHAIPCAVATLAFNLLSSVLFFASIHGVVPFYSRGLPEGLRGW
jgi:MBOAT, membrane-bound O-acyltransferase family